MTIYKRKKQGFTLTELVTVLIMMLFVGAVVSKEAVNNTKKQNDIQKIKTVYGSIEKSAMVWQSENDCSEDIKECVFDAKRAGIRSPYMFNGIAKYLPVVAATVPLEAKGRRIEAQDLSDADWLPEQTITFDGMSQRVSSVGVSKYDDGRTNNTAFYLLQDGTTISVTMPDVNSNTGYGFYDINGKEGANKIGVDVFPFSIGANISRQNPIYDVAANKLNPYFYTSVEGINSGMCNIVADVCASDKLSANPTAYVLRFEKMPR